MLKIAITGGAGTGKSTVARMFAELGAEVLDADQIARDVVAVGAPAWVELRRLYGPEYFNENGELNRSKLAQLVFADPEERRRLDRLIHPRVEAELKARVAELDRRGVQLVMVEGPLLFETGREAAFDRVIVVAAPEAAERTANEKMDDASIGARVKTPLLIQRPISSMTTDLRVMAR